MAGLPPAFSNVPPGWRTGRNLHGTSAMYEMRTFPCDRSLRLIFPLVCGWKLATMSSEWQPEVRGDAVHALSVLRAVQNDKRKLGTEQLCKKQVVGAGRRSIGA